MAKLTFSDLRNDTDMQFTDISSEKYRNYVFAGGEALRIEEPLALHVSESGGHRVLNADGESIYVPKGFIMLIWEAKDDEPHFVR